MRGLVDAGEVRHHAGQVPAQEDRQHQKGTDRVAEPVEHALRHAVACGLGSPGSAFSSAPTVIGAG